MNEFLAYRYPGEQLEKWSGNWETSDFNQIDLRDKNFVISNFDRTAFSVFKPKGKLHNITVKNLGQSNLKPISKKKYIDKLKFAMELMCERSVDKIIFSRIKHQKKSTKSDNAIFENLLLQYPDAFVYFLNSKKWGCWMGASPEILIKQKSTSSYETIALAGTLPVEKSNNWSSKEKVEQQYVADYIEKAIQINGKLVSKSEIKEKIAGPVKHLATTFSFNINNGKIGNMITDLHPTPAVCGVPFEDAKSLIFEIESHNRDLYAGFLGLLGGDQTHLFVNLRCMRCFHDSVDIYVGGGITADSVPENEWEETERKASTLINVIT